MSSVARFAKGKKRIRSKGSSQPKAFRKVARNSNMSAVVARERQRRSLQLRNVVTAGFLGIEKKFYDTAKVLTNVGAPADCTSGEYDPGVPAATTLISTPAVGDSEQNREGKKINILSVEVEGIVRTATAELIANPPAACDVMVALVLDTQTNGANMNSEDCYKNLAAEASQAANPTRNLLFAQRFRVLKSKIFKLTPPSLSHFAVDSFAYPGVSRTFKWFINFPKGLPVNFNAGQTADVANVLDNSLHIIAFANTNSPTPQIGYNARVRFVG